MVSLVGEIGRRKVFRVAAVYAVVAWLIVQIVAAIHEPLNLPDWFDTFVIVLLAIGFPIALLLGWIFDFTPEGIRPTDARESQGRAGTAIAPFSYIVQVLVLLAVAFLVADQYWFDGTRPIASRAAAGVSGVDPVVSRFVYSVPSENAIREGSVSTQLDLSRDGRFFIYGSQNGIYRRALDDLEAELIRGSEVYRAGLILSPDGQFVAFYGGRGITGFDIVSIDGGAVSSMNVDGGLGPLGEWGLDGEILMARNDGIYTLSASNGNLQLIHPAREGEVFGNARWLPGGETLIVTSRTVDQSWDDASILAISPNDGARTLLLEGGDDPRYVPTGHLLFARGQAMYAVAFHLETLTVSGVPTAVVQGVQRAQSWPGVDLRVSSNGTLIYLRPFPDQRRLAWIDRQGQIQELAAPPRNYWYIQLAADDSHVSIDAWDAEDRRDIWIRDLLTGGEQRITYDPEPNRSAIWSPDGERVTFTRTVDDGSQEIFWRAADLSGENVQLSITDRDVMPTDFSPEGDILLFQETGPPRDVWALAVEDAPSEGFRLWESSASEFNATISPDGRWLAYQSDETGRYEIWVRPYPDIDAGGPWQVSVNGGAHPLWGKNPNDLEIFYLDLNGSETGVGALYAVAVESGATFQPQIPQKLFENSFVVPSNFTGPYDVTQDGERFLMIRPDQSQQEIVVIQNWFEELNRLVPINPD